MIYAYILFICQGDSLSQDAWAWAWGFGCINLHGFHSGKRIRITLTYATIMDMILCL